MLTRRFGRTEIAMPLLTLGGMRFQHSWNSDDAPTADSQANLEAIVRSALEHGVNHVETARGYGTSEKQLGKALSRFQRHEYILQTKIAPREDPALFEREVFDSLGRLRVAHADLLAIHGVNDQQTLEWTCRDGGCLERALLLQQRGIVRYVGFSTHAPSPIIEKAIADGRFDYVNLHYYWANQQNLGCIRAAAARDMGVLIISPNDKGGRLYEPPDKLRHLTAPLSPMTFNDLFCWANPEIATISIGASKPRDLDEHLQAIAQHKAQSTDSRSVIAAIEGRLTSEYERVLGKSWATTWHVGLPSWENVPGHINVREILRLYNLASAFDLVEHARSRYNLLDDGGHWFPGKPVNDFDERELLAALAASPHAEKIPELLRAAQRMLAGDKVKRLQQK
jgi:predicted aldo/keto reductase-like oxidoreductase